MSASSAERATYCARAAALMVDAAEGQAHLDRRPRKEERDIARALTPTLSAFYASRHPELARAPRTESAQWEAGVEDFMRLVEERAVEGRIIVTIADKPWENLLVNWLAAMRLLRLDGYVVLSVDASLHHSLQEIGVPSHHIAGGVVASAAAPPAMAGETEEDAANLARSTYHLELWNKRWLLISEALKRGYVAASAVACPSLPSLLARRPPVHSTLSRRYHVINTDVDAVWLRDPTPVLQMAQQTGVHIVAGKGALKPHWVVCLGWVMITSDSKVRFPSPLKPTTPPAPLTAPPQVLDRLPQFMSTLMATRDDQRAYVEKALLLLLLLLLLLITATYD